MKTAAVLHGRPHAWTSFDFAQDRVALAALYNSTGGEHWADSPGNRWLRDSCHCRWVGVSCLEKSACDESPVIEIERSGKNLTGVLPSWSGDPGQSALPQLQRLTLTDNPGLTGSIPETWGDMAQMRRVWLYHNNLVGTLPGAFATMTQMRELQVYENLLSGSLPEAYAKLSEMVALDVSSNSIGGTLVEAYGQLRKMTQLWMYSNNIEGVLPPAWGNLAQLTGLSMFNNKLSGSLPKVRHGVHMCGGRVVGGWRSLVRCSVPCCE